MSDDIRQLATALVALSESNLEIGAALREEIVSRREEARKADEAARETNGYLANISRQNEEILEQMKISNDRHRESEKAIRAIRSTTDDHGQKIALHTEHLVAIGQAVGLPYPGAQ